MLIFWSKSYNLKSQPELKQFANYDDIIFVTKSMHLPTLEKGDLLVVMGTSNLKEVQAEGHLPKNRTITSLREKLYPFHDGQMMVTFDLGIKNIDYTNYVKLQTDLTLVDRVLRTGSIDPTLGHYQWVKDFEHLPPKVNELYNRSGRPVRVAMDLETVGLDPFAPEVFIVSISFSIEEGMSDLVRFKGIGDQPMSHSLLWDQINWMLNDDRISLIGANLKFDLMWIRVKWGMLCSNFKSGSAPF